jgi:hypothetical protein
MQYPPLIPIYGHKIKHPGRASYLGTFKGQAMEGENAKKNGGGLVLLNCFVSPFGNRVKIALVREGVAYEEKSENLAAKSPLLLSSNPVHGTIPCSLLAASPCGRLGVPCHRRVHRRRLPGRVAAPGRSLRPRPVPLLGLVRKHEG